MKLSHPTATATTTKVAVILALASASGGCAARRPPTELVDARAAYARAAADDVARAAPASLDEARHALDAAEREHAKNPSSEAAKSLAYVAHRKALVAEANAHTAVAAAQQAGAFQVLTALRRSELADAENRAERLEDKADLDALPEGRRRAKVALDRLSPFAAISEESNCTVVTLDDSILFEGETAELMPTARDRLDRVVQALHEIRARSVLVRGHMDRTRDPRRDATLARGRADAVRQYLISRGIPPEQVRAQGLGTSVPVLSNASAEGRNENRRVEIVIEGPASGPTKR
jgi:outer membrane protein OmpA-like peptidoglycan-associated protein